MTVLLLNLEQKRERLIGLSQGNVEAVGQLVDEPKSFSMLLNWKMSYFLYLCTNVSTLPVRPFAAFPLLSPPPPPVLNSLSIPSAC